MLEFRIYSIYRIELVYSPDLPRRGYVTMGKEVDTGVKIIF